VPTSTLNPTQIGLIPPTSTSAPTATNTPTPVVTITQDILNPTQAALVTPTLPIPTNTPLPTQTPYIESAYKEDFKTYMTNINSFADLTEADFRWIFGMQLLRQKIFESVTANETPEQEQVWARHIAVSEEAQAQSIYDRLINGEDFETIATEVYSGTGNISDMGWFRLGAIDINAEKVVFNTDIGQITEPIQTAGGWEIYQVLGHEVRPLSDTEFEQLKQTVFQNWLDQRKTTEGVETFDIWKTKVPVRPTIPPTQPAQ
jgi:hypothetical protein